MVVRDFQVDFPLSSCGPGPDMAMWMLEAAIVSQHVASQMRSRPWAQGVMVIPSGHLPSEQDSPCGSNTDGMLALVRDCLMMVFNLLWWGSLPLLLQQLQPCSPVSSTRLPQWVQSWGAHKWVPNRRLVAIRIVVLHIRSPRELIGGAVSHAPDSFWLQACNRALSLGLAACWLSRREKQLSTTNESQVFCLVAATPVGGLTDWSTHFPHFTRTWAWMVGREGVMPAGRMACEVRALLAAEAK